MSGEIVTVGSTTSSFRCLGILQSTMRRDVRQPTDRSQPCGTLHESCPLALVLTSDRLVTRAR